VRSDDVYLVRRIRVAPISALAADPGLTQLAGKLERMHDTRSTELKSVDKEIKRTRPGSLSSPAIYGSIAVSAAGLVDAIATATTGVPWLSLTFAVGGVVSGGVGAKDKLRENALRRNRNFERKVLRRDLDEITQARIRVRRALASVGSDRRRSR
jgi:hypothetical protein